MTAPRPVLTVILTIGLLAAPLASGAQQPKRVPRMGYLENTGDPKTPGPLAEAFRQGLRDLGYNEGRNILVDYRYAEGNLDRVPGLVNELVQLKVDVFVSGNLPAIRAAKQATKTIPIVMVISLDPVVAGIGPPKPYRVTERLTGLPTTSATRERG